MPDNFASIPVSHITVSEHVNTSVATRLLRDDGSGTVDDDTLRWLADLLAQAAEHSKDARVLLLESRALRSAIGAAPASDAKVQATLIAREIADRLVGGWPAQALNLPVMRD